MRRLLLVLALAGAFVIGNATAAAAHGVGGREPTNVRVELDPLVPPVPGVAVRVVDFGTKLELENTTGRDVIVLGYAGEPYLRVGPDGVFRNERSPATFINRTNDPPASVPDEYDASAPTQWERLGGGDTVSWHDHRAHYMGQTGPFVVTLTRDGVPIELHGTITIEHPGPWWPWLLVVAALAIGVAVAARGWWRATVATALGLLIIGESAHIIGSWSEIASSFGGRLSAQLIPLGAVILAFAALARVMTSSSEQAAPIVLVAAIVMIVAGGVSDVSVWWHSQVPSALSAGVARALVTATFGLGIGVAIAAASRLRPTTPDDRTPPTAGPTAPHPD